MATLQLKPEQIQADDNTRFTLKRSSIDQMKASILERGRVLEPVLVVALAAPTNGKTHRLIAGFVRHASVEELNAKEQAGLTIPVEVLDPTDDLDRIRMQIEENLIRSEQSPMDKATAMKRLMDLGVERKEVRRIFGTVRGKKATSPTPISNASLNIYLNMLDLPKTIQEKIHSGAVGIEASYELGKVSPDKRAAVLARAEAKIQDQLDIEEKDEKQFLTQASKVEEKQAEAVAAMTEAEQVTGEIAGARTNVTTTLETLRSIQKAPMGDGRTYLELTPEEKAGVSEKLKAAEQDHKSAVNILKAAENKAVKLKAKAKTAEEKAADARARLENARKSASKGKKLSKGKIGGKDVKVAAKAEGEDTGAVPLSASEMRQAIKDVSNSKFQRVAFIGKGFLQMMNGIGTAKILMEELAKLTGEVPSKVQPLK